MQGFRRFSQVIVLKTKQDAARKELRFINQTRKRHFDKPSYMYLYIYICIYMYVCLCIFIYITMYVCIYICIYICIYEHTHKQTKKYATFYFPCWRRRLSGFPPSGDWDPGRSWPFPPHVSPRSSPIPKGWTWKIDENCYPEISRIPGVCGYLLSHFAFCWVHLPFGSFWPRFGSIFPGFRGWRIVPQNSTWLVNLFNQYHKWDIPRLFGETNPRLVTHLVTHLVT